MILKHIFITLLLLIILSNGVLGYEYLQTEIICGGDGQTTILCGSQTEKEVGLSMAYLIAVMMGLVAVGGLLLYVYNSFSPEDMVAKHIKMLFLILGIGMWVVILRIASLILEGLANFSQAIVDDMLSIFSSVQTASLILLFIFIVYWLFSLFKDIYVDLMKLAKLPEWKRRGGY